MGTYFTVVPIIGLILSKNFDAAYGHRENIRVSCVASLVYGVASIVACFGLKRRAPWSTGLIMALSFLSIIYAASFFASNNLHSSGATFVALLSIVGVFSIFAVWKSRDFAQQQAGTDEPHTL
jgi:nicotinamide riboside transporter PnuC